MKEAVIVSAVRTAVGKAGRGTLVDTRPEDMAGVVLGEVIERAAPVSVDEVEDVILGCAISGGVESMSMVPMTNSKISLNLWMVENYPEIYIGMGQTAENVAVKYGINREDQDAFAYQSHQRAIAAQDAGKFDDEIVPLEIKQVASGHWVAWNGNGDDH